MKHSTLLAVLLVAFAAQGQTKAPATSPAADAERLVWTPLRGTATDLSVGADGTAFTLDRDGLVWMRRAGGSSGNNSWLRLPGHFRRIDAASDRLAWAVDEDGAVFRYNGTYWRQIEDAKALDIGVGAGGTAFAVLTDGTLARFDARKEAFVTVEGAPKALSRVDVDDKEQPWVVLAEGGIRRFDGRTWLNLPGQATDIAAGAGAALAVSPDQQPLRWNATTGRWTALAARAAVVAVGANGHPWLATPDGEIFAQQPDEAVRSARSETASQVFTQVLNWRKLRGTAKSLAISAKGQVLALGPEGEIWQWKGKDDWLRLPGQLARVALAPDGRPWGIAEDGKILQHQGSYWVELPGSAKDIAIGAGGAVWIASAEGELAQWQPAQRQWLALPDTTNQTTKTAPKAKRLAVDPEGRPWIIDAQGLVLQHDGKRWVDYPGISAQDLAIGPEASILAIAEGKPWRYNRLNKRWERLSGEATAIAVGPKGMPWAVTARNEIYASAFFEEETPAPITHTVVAGALKTTPAPLAGTAAAATVKEVLGLASFTQARNVAARDIAIGNDGSVFALAFDGSMLRWNNGQQKFLAFPGQFARIAVAADGKPWGVTTRNEVWRHDGMSWRVVNGIAALDIAAGFDGTVIAAATDEVLYRYNSAENRFERMLAAREGDPAPQGSKLAVSPQGKPWTIGKDGRVRRCDRASCELLAQTARDIEIGPEGSVFISDLERKLRRFNTATGEWDRVGIDAEGVAVGPGGLPWVVNGKSEVWYAALFKRDESNDIAKAAASSTTTTTATSTTSTAPVFSFTVNMPFETVAVPAGLGSNSFNIAEGPGGRIVALDKINGFWNYDTARKTWQKDTSVPSVTSLIGGDRVRSLVIGKDGTYWLSRATGDGPYRVWRRQGGAWIAVPGLDDCAATPGCSTDSSMSVAMGPDGTIYATSAGNNLYRYDATQQRFVRHTAVPRPPDTASFVTVDPGGRFWVGTTDQSIYEYYNNAWVKRSSGSRIMAAWQCLNWERPCVGIGANGTVYSQDEWQSRRLARWNPNGGSWDLVTSSPTFGVTFMIASDGRPWIWDGSVLYKAK